ncbi:hypothetical protein TRVL_09791 [Trypanosoma vivax]|nr:hypothetical protein TRVL_09791 [Trypanosoma vivax]
MQNALQKALGVGFLLNYAPRTRAVHWGWALPFGAVKIRRNNAELKCFRVLLLPHWPKTVAAWNGMSLRSFKGAPRSVTPQGNKNIHHKSHGYRSFKCGDSSPYSFWIIRPSVLQKRSKTRMLFHLTL